MRTTQYIKANDWVTIAEKIAAKHGGVLPNPQALINDGYWALYQQMRRNPGLFRHIKQSKKFLPKKKFPTNYEKVHSGTRKVAMCLG